jgi:hypothetical protein
MKIMCGLLSPAKELLKNFFVIGISNKIELNIILVIEFKF